MALKFLALVIVAAIAVNMADGQFDVNSQAKGTTFNLLGVQVTLYCTPDGTTGPFGPAAPPFGGAEVHLICGNSEIIANGTTNSFGITYLVTNPMPFMPFSPPESNCKVVVNTKLASCNSTLPSGFLESPLVLIGTYILKNLKVFNFAPSGFSLVPSV